MKRKLLVGALILVCLSILVGGSWAYYTQTVTAHNVITSGEINIELLEWADLDGTVPFPAEGKDGVLPGMSVTKRVEVKNTGDSAAYIRVRIDKAIALAEGVEAEADTALLTLSLNQTDWTAAAENGVTYYYYNEPLAAGATTEPLFTDVTFAAAMGNEYQNSTATVDVTAYAVQVANNGTSAQTAAGWPE